MVKFTSPSSWKKDHQHKWLFMTTKNSFEAANPGNSDLYLMVEYAFLICNGCTTVIKEKVLTKAEVEGGEL